MDIDDNLPLRRDDPLANLNWHEEDFIWLTKALCDLANRHGNGRVVSLLEGHGVFQRHAFAGVPALARDGCAAAADRIRLQRGSHADAARRSPRARARGTRRPLVAAAPPGRAAARPRPRVHSRQQREQRHLFPPALRAYGHARADVSRVGFAAGVVQG